jgi:hypothetical protein
LYLPDTRCPYYLLIKKTEIMKNIILIVAALLMTSGAFAQTTTTTETTTTVTKKAAAKDADTKYCCTKCDHCSSKAGSCPMHKTAMVMEGKYYCPMDADVSSDKAGNCPKCGMAMKKMEMETATKYCCNKCGIISPVKGQCPHSTEAIMKDGELKCALCYDKEGKCPKCGTEMEKVEIKKKKKA